MNEHYGKKLLYTVTGSGVIQEYYDMDEVAKFQIIANQWRIITYRSFSAQRTLKGKDLLKAVYENRKYDVDPIPTEEYAVRDGELCGFVKELGCCDINGGAGGWKGIRKSVIYFLIQIAHYTITIVLITHIRPDTNILMKPMRSFLWRF